MTEVDFELHLNDPRHAIDFVLSTSFFDIADAEEFLRAWREGDLREWPEYVDYVRHELNFITSLQEPQLGETNNEQH